MNQPRKSASTRHRDAKSLLSALKMTTTIGAVSLTLAGWGLLSRVEANTVTEATPINPNEFANARTITVNPTLKTTMSSESGQLDISRAISTPRPEANMALTRPTATPTIPPTITDAPSPEATKSVKSTPAVVARASAERSPLTPVASSSTATVPAATPTDTPTVLPTAPTVPDTPIPTATPLFKLDVVQWLQTQAGDDVAVVRDNRGTLWYVMGTDIPLIEQGRQPVYQPQPVNGFARSRRS